MPLLLLLAALAAAEDEPWQDEGWGWGGLPAVNYNSDEGFGFGVVGSVYRYDGEQAPYKTAIDLVLFASTKAVHDHSLTIDALELGGAPIRLTVRADMRATRSSNYCGTGSGVTCDPAVAPNDTFYKTRFVYPQLRADIRWTLDPKPHRLELLAGWRGGLLIPGDFDERAPYPDSLYAAHFPGGEEARVSVLQAGVMLDDRDNEPAPTKGYWIEASVRGASPLWGASFAYVGFNSTLRGYVPLGSERLVLAERVVLDGQVGDVPTVELAVPGGSQRYDWYGSLNAGRGIRLRRYIGEVMTMSQTELRYTFARPKVFGVQLDLTTLAFLDLAFVASDWQHLEELATPLPGEGVGLRVAFEQNFIVRVDVAVSHLEDYAPGVYIDLRNTF